MHPAADDMQEHSPSTKAKVTAAAPSTLRLESPFHAAARRGQLELLKSLRSAATLDLLNDDHNTALILAASRGHAAVIEYLAIQGASMEATTRDHSTALLVAVRKGHVGTARLLVQHGADIEARNKAGETALAIAAKVQNAALVELLVQHGADVNAVPIKSLCAIVRRALDAVRILSAFLCSSQTWSMQLKETLLECAFLFNKPSVVSLLVPVTPLDRMHKRSHTWLQRATVRVDCDDEGPACLLLLLQHGLNPELRDREGSTPLSLAIAAQNAWAVKILAAYTDLTSIDGLGLTYLGRAANRPTVLALLLQAGADPNARDPMGRTPLYHAVQKGNLRSVELLLPLTRGAKDHRFTRRVSRSYFEVALASENVLVTRYLYVHLFADVPPPPTHALFFQPFAALSVPRQRFFFSRVGWFRAVASPLKPMEAAYINALCAIVSDPTWPSRRTHAMELPADAQSLLEAELDTFSPALFLHPAHGVVVSDAHLTSWDARQWRTLLAPLTATRGSDSPVQDVVSPSVGCGVIGQTQWQASSHEMRLNSGNVLSWASVVPPEWQRHVSEHFQWLPTPVHVDDATGKATFTSYINDLDPGHTRIYDALAATLTQLLPLLAVSTHTMLHDVPRVQRTQVLSTSELVRRLYHAHSNETPTSSKVRRWQRQQTSAGVDFEALAMRPVFVDTVPTWPFPSMSLPRDLLVHVAITTLHATPTFAGQKWTKGSGLVNEFVVAVGVVVCDCNNVADVAIEFAHELAPPRSTTKGAATAASPQLQRTGYMGLTPGRLVSIPTAGVYRIAPFSAADASKPGHVTLVTYYLVHPDASLLSTAHVLPQHKAWLHQHLGGTRLGALPDGVLDDVLDFVGCGFVRDAERAVLAAADKQVRTHSLAAYQLPAAML
ncbi:hypothetical protein SDRG_04628 [Saprolegnia diclina VS20]|uniref:DUF4246 domain-containing protein n=1 Tax=Saprolegnia diclina (strain VS20) TaxID=1156394 RepID=T0QU05_SAPDV|nr:hypothetical protein SDRG_04628 [Saprolegnia diclina VS20]EQC38201.1 hypothetical protein SDRG_04628 [Saprolegnia diclina VS20]|eukprot:XP_008608528.1 hypothetical protein SDRG_04628 [Saprolegnia diclina VS20]